MTTARDTRRTLCASRRARKQTRKVLKNQRTIGKISADKVAKAKRQASMAGALR